MKQMEIKVYGYRWVVLVVFALIQLSIQILWSTFLPITGEAATFYGVTPLSIGMLSMMFMFVYIFVSLPSSWVISNLGVKKGVGFAVVLMGTFGLVRGLFGNHYTVVLICTVMLSIAQPFIINSITTMTARWFPVDERATATGLALLAQLVGIMGGMVITPILTAAIGIVPMLMSYGIFSASLMVIFLIVYREHPPTPPSLVEVVEELPKMREGLKHVFKNRDSVLLMIIFCGGMVAFNSISTWIEQILAPRGFDSIDAGSIGGMMMLGGILGCIILPLLSDKTKRRKLFLIIGVVAMIPGLVGLSYFETFPLLLIVGGLLGFFQLGLGPIIMEAAANVCQPATEATTQGVLWMFGQGFSVVGIFLMDSFRTESGAMTPFILVFAVIMACSLILAATLNESKLTSFEIK
ncbi:MFS transporter [bacterium]|nr:MFS transporter [bacterium]